MRGDSYSNSRGETVMTYMVFRAIPATRIHTRLQSKGVKVVKSRRTRRELNGSLTSKKAGNN